MLRFFTARGSENPLAAAVVASHQWTTYRWAAHGRSAAILAKERAAALTAISPLASVSALTPAPAISAVHHRTIPIAVALAARWSALAEAVADTGLKLGIAHWRRKQFCRHAAGVVLAAAVLHARISLRGPRGGRQHGKS
jgi:hypothetical protein